MPAGHRVAIVAAPGFTSELGAACETVHVWAIDTPEYRRLAEAHWRTSPGHSLERGVTLFKAADAEPQAAVIEILGTVEEHHGEHSHDPPLDEIAIIGAAAGTDLCAELSARGFSAMVSSQQGFVATRRPSTSLPL